jgi:hypothetical protein
LTDAEWKEQSLSRLNLPVCHDPEHNFTRAVSTLIRFAPIAFHNCLVPDDVERTHNQITTKYPAKRKKTDCCIGIHFLEATP